MINSDGTINCSVWEIYCNHSICCFALGGYSAFEGLDKQSTIELDPEKCTHPTAEQGLSHQNWLSFAIHRFFLKPSDVKLSSLRPNKSQRNLAALSHFILLTLFSLTAWWLSYVQRSLSIFSWLQCYWVWSQEHFWYWLSHINLTITYCGLSHC